LTSDRKDVIERRGFENQYYLYGKLKREHIKALDYETLQAWKRLQRHVISEVKFMIEFFFSILLK